MREQHELEGGGSGVRAAKATIPAPPDSMIIGEKILSTHNTKEAVKKVTTIWGENGTPLNYQLQFGLYTPD
ncbi:hypothetical protein RJ641_010923 [Dillenia turbinata]|uniref:Uncharacterized protein n=1 Tax=Dillenia turbinata TaxID=194707 RepID=A0AAN8Z167_9MAGN